MPLPAPVTTAVREFVDMRRNPITMARMHVRVCLAVLLGLVVSSSAAAQQRPLVTEDPETVGGGRVLVEAGLDHEKSIFFPGSGLTGNLLEVPTVGISVGLSSIAEIQFDGGVYRRLHVTDRELAPNSYKLTFPGDSTSDVDDLTVATKLKVLSERGNRPSFGLRLATKLPNASNETGLGLDTMDFSAVVLAGKTIGSNRFVANLGGAIPGDTVRGDRQSDVLVYGLSMAHAIAEGLEVVGEVHGPARRAWEFPRPGPASRATGRGGIRYTRGGGRIAAGLLLGPAREDPGIGLTVGPRSGRSLGPRGSFRS